MMKRITAVLLAVAMLCSMSVVVTAQEAVTVSVGSIEGEIGDIVQVPVNISDGHYAVNGRVFLTYDPTAMELQAVCDDEENPYFESVNTAIFDESYMWAFAVPVAGRANFIFVSSADAGNTVGGTMYTLTFKLLKEVKKGALTLTIPEMRSNNGGDDFDTAVTPVNGTVDIIPVDYTPNLKGDIDGNGIVDLFDSIRLVYYHSGLLDITPKQRKNADINDDGDITLYDVVKLFNYVSGNGTL